MEHCLLTTDQAIPATFAMIGGNGRRAVLIAETPRTMNNMGLESIVCTWYLCLGAEKRCTALKYGMSSADH